MGRGNHRKTYGRAHAKKMKLKHKVLIVLAILIVLSLSFLIMNMKTDVFDITKITILGNNKVSQEKIVSSSEIVKGRNIFTVDLKTAKENLLLHSYIKKVKIKRKLPNEIVMMITERGEIAAVPHDDSLVYFGFDGMILDIVKEKKSGSTPIVEGLELDKPYIGSRAVIKKKTKQEAEDIIHFLEVYSNRGLKKITKSVVFDRDMQVHFKLNLGTDVAFGVLNNIEYKVTFLIETLKDLENKKIKAKTIYLNKGSDIIVELSDS